jgi:hypothetical protein
MSRQHRPRRPKRRARRIREQAKSEEREWASRSGPVRARKVEPVKPPRPDAVEPTKNSGQVDGISVSPQATSPEERSNVLVGEIYRHRLALLDQARRLEERVEELRHARERVDSEVFGLIVSPDWSEEWFKQQYEALKREQIPEVWRLRSDAQFLLTAARGLYLVAEALRDLADGTAKECFAAALDKFVEAVPDHALLRHIHEHYSDYLAGRGHLQHRLPSPINEETSAIGLLDEGVAIFIGGKLFLLWEVREATDRLAASVAECSTSVVLTSRLDV